MLSGLTVQFSGEYYWLYYSSKILGWKIRNIWVDNVILKRFKFLRIYGIFGVNKILKIKYKGIKNATIL